MQELFSNAVRHAHAQVIQVHVNYAADGIAILVRDDVYSFDPQAVSQKGFGLEEMRQRADLLDARLAIHSNPGNGADVTMEFEV